MQLLIRKSELYSKQNMKNMLLLRIARNAIRIYYAKQFYACCFCNESNFNSQG